MNDWLQKLRKERILVFCCGIAYFLVLLAAGIFVFLKNAAYANMLVAGCLGIYLLAVRPVLSRYQRLLRRAMLEINLGKYLNQLIYEPKQGFSQKELEETGLTPVPLKSHLSREKIRGKAGIFRVSAADVTFPFHNGNLNEMFNGCAVCLGTDFGEFPPLRMEAGVWKAGEPDPRTQALAEEIGSLIPGSLYLKTQDNRMYVILRGRFLGFKINPLMDVTENTLSKDPLPELGQILKLARQLCQ